LPSKFSVEKCKNVKIECGTEVASRITDVIHTSVHRELRTEFYLKQLYCYVFLLTW